MRLIFAGTPAFAATHLESLVGAGHDIVAVYTQPDRPAGRGKKVQPTPVKAVAEQHGIPVFQPARLDAQATAELAGFAPDLMIVVAYGLILSPAVLQTPRFGCINVHASLLPRWRGAAPIERAILAGDKETGICIMQMDAGLDTGDVLLALKTPIGHSDNALTITERLATLGCEGLEKVLADLGSFQANARTQDDSHATYAAKLAKEEAAIDWMQPAALIQRQVQAFYPRSPAWCPFRGDRLRIIEAVSKAGNAGAVAGTILAVASNAITVACGENRLEISAVQLPGKKPMAMQDVLNGHPDLFTPGATLSAAHPA